MSLKTLKAQLLRDLQASWRKTALLALLLIVGLIVWIPPLVRAMTRSGVPAESTVATSSTTPSAPIPPARETSTEPLDSDWETAQRILTSDPLVAPAEAALLPRDPFQIDLSQIPLPILFAEEPPVPKTAPSVAAVRSAAPPPQLTLVSTIIGANRRAAYINGRLCYEGSQLRADGDMVTVVSIAPRRVVVRRGDDEFELKIAGRGWGSGDEASPAAAGP